MIGQVVISTAMHIILVDIMIVNLTKNEIKHLVYLMGKGDVDFFSDELNEKLLNTLEPLIEVCTCKEKNSEDEQ